jgi:hypothetical protein
MKMEWLKFLFNGFLLIVPILIWNGIFFSRLPAQYQPPIFEQGIHPIISFGENILRIVIFGLPLLFMVGLSTKTQYLGLGLYLAGVIIYFLSWLPLIFAPESAWSTSLPGFMAPAYTPILWMVGVALWGDSFYLPIAYKPLHYLIPAALFSIFHCVHAVLVYIRNF